ncbi:polysaccharide lyase family 7 protein [Algibacter luteus]|uniref:Alginate lyase n=1 Tax=Algibacter luteus TaxID=1178825 RepID=A0A1M6A7K3_9FLAO|nr:polysaccharide lyase family 7 protein [Algibacter luteus]SHI32458.1 Alginate lyase [Algibacter luteus]
MKCIKVNKLSILLIIAAVLMFGCKNVKKESNIAEITEKIYPSDVLPVIKDCSLLCGDGTSFKNLDKVEHDDFFYVENDGKTNWVVYKTPNSGITSRTSSNTRTELGQKAHWIPETGGRLTGTLKVQHVSTSGDARVSVSYSVVVGQIHSDEGHENEPLKIFYKKFPGHEKGSVFWNYEINTKGDNSKRWDYSTAVWGYNMSVVGTSPSTNPEEPGDGIALGEEFSYEVNVHEGIMFLTFKSEGHETKTFVKNLLQSDFSEKSDLPEQIKTVYATIGRDGVEQENAYAGELQYFKQGAYNQTNGKDPNENIVWYTGAEVFDGDIAKQYAHGSYAEVWFRESTMGESIAPSKD